MNQARVYTFNHPRGQRDVEFGPYQSDYEAREAFQRCYGYWPAPPIVSRPWEKVS